MMILLQQFRFKDLHTQQFRFKDLHIMKGRQMCYVRRQCKDRVFVIGIIVANPRTQTQVGSKDGCTTQSCCVVYKIDAHSSFLW